MAYALMALSYDCTPRHVFTHISWVCNDIFIVKNIKTKDKYILLGYWIPPNRKFETHTSYQRSHPWRQARVKSVFWRLLSICACIDITKLLNLITVVSQISFATLSEHELNYSCYIYVLSLYKCFHFSFFSCIFQKAMQTLRLQRIL